jgi:hypothetical protein
MTKTPARPATATGLATAILLIAGCGSSSNTTSKHNATRSSSSGSQTSVTQYIQAVTALQRPIPAAASPFLHAPDVNATRIRRARELQHAYATAAKRLSAITPPAVGAAAQRRLVNVWSGVAAGLAKAIEHQPFHYGKAYEIAAAAEQPTAQAYNDILTLP